MLGDTLDAPRDLINLRVPATIKLIFFHEVSLPVRSSPILTEGSPLSQHSWRGQGLVYGPALGDIFLVAVQIIVVGLVIRILSTVPINNSFLSLQKYQPRSVRCWLYSFLKLKNKIVSDDKKNYKIVRILLYAYIDTNLTHAPL